MKKLLVLLTVAVGIFAFSTGAFAQGLLDVCIPCTKCPVGNVGCPEDIQGRPATCGYFDFEDWTTYSSGRTALDNCVAVFSVCNCENPEETFVVGARFGVRLTIMVNDQFGQLGAYWSAPGSAQINFGLHATQADACRESAYPSTFGPGNWFKSTTAGEESDAVSSLASGTTCAVGSANQATMIKTDETAGYTISPADVTASLARWAIDIPPIRIDPNVLKNGEKISVRIEILALGTGGICADCDIVCECIIDVAYVCPQDAYSTACLFPYFTSTTAPNDSQPWWNGIAIVNTGSQPGTATLSVTQQDGAKGTYTTESIPAGSIFVRALDQIPFVASSGTLGDLPLWIQVTTTFKSMDGFAIIASTDTGESMGYLCRLGH